MNAFTDLCLNHAPLAFVLFMLWLFSVGVVAQVGSRNGYYRGWDEGHREGEKEGVRQVREVAKRLTERRARQ